ncbi:MAG: GNAT family N-acetyltransferase [Candidatus Bathyarchaeota archaeon]|nr:GNAT family N-acetyltransferase [Candidatus Bathyarchaeota archaeon]
MTLLELLPKNNQVTVQPYSSKYKIVWNDFISKSKNGVFMFNRDYMDYHSSRFHDYSLLFFKGKKLVAVLPANMEQQTLFSHGGLTFGGIISNYDMTQKLMLKIVEALLEYCKTENIIRILYKTIPHIYHVVPAEEDLYALFRHQARLVGRNLSSTIDLTQTVPFDKSRKENIRKARKNNLEIKRSYDINTFMKIAQEILMEKHGVTPVHTVDELALLMKRFPDNIKLFGSFLHDEMVAGVIIFESKNVAHGQYAANSYVGRRIGAQDIIEDYLINDYYRNKKKFFDFGISTLHFGKEVNEGLLSRKEGFGASAVAYDTYEVIAP